jgi:hypothetical protein
MQLALTRREQVMSENRLAVVLALIIFAMVIVGWIVQLGGGYRAGSARNDSYGDSNSRSLGNHPNAGE